MDREKMKKGYLILMLILFFLIPLLIAADCLAELYFPLSEGMVWEYQYIMKNVVREGHTHSNNVIRKALAPRKLNDKEVFPLQDQKGNLLFVLADDVGVCYYAQQSIRDTEPKIFQPTEYFLKYPLKEGATEETRKKTILLNPHVDVDVDVTMTIETLTDTVTVPAGTFENCLRIKYS
jgi:hypothetical protein